MKHAVVEVTLVIVTILELHLSRSVECLTVHLVGSIQDGLLGIPLAVNDLG